MAEVKVNSYLVAGELARVFYQNERKKQQISPGWSDKAETNRLNPHRVFGMRNPCVVDVHHLAAAPSGAGIAKEMRHKPFTCSYSDDRT